MITLKLKDQYTFAIEFYDKRLRLIVLDGINEWVCRKVTQKEFTAFLQNDEAHLFKGRLKLVKTGSDILVNVKGNDVGLISSRSLLQSSNLALDGA